MAEQFSPEYIEFILSNKALQEKWEPKIRDIFIVRDGDGAHFLVVDTRGPEYPFNHWLMSYVYLSPYGPGSGELPTLDARVSDQSVWLPTFWDLLQIIEGAGYEWDKDGELWYAREIAGNTVFVFDSLEEGEDMLAAAKLAVRVLTKGG